MLEQCSELPLTFTLKESTPPFPRVEVKMLHDSAGIYGLFQVHDNFVRVVQTQDQAPVYTDSCVEFFVQPNTGKEYFNFEMNGGGVLLLYKNHNPETEDHLEIPHLLISFVVPADVSFVFFYFLHFPSSFLFF